MALKFSRKVLDSPPSCSTDLDTLINALAERKDVQKLTAVSNNVGSGERGLGESEGSKSAPGIEPRANRWIDTGKLLHTGQIDKMMASYIGQ